MGIRQDWWVVKNVQGECGDCIYQVQALKPTENDPEGWMSLSVISNSQSLYHSMWRHRIKNAWKVLRNNYDWSGFELNSREEAEEFVTALTECIEAAFPEATDG